MRKGITPVIAIILLLLITISMVGFAFVWFSRVQQISTEQTEKGLQSQLNQQAMKIRVDNVVTVSGVTTVTIRSTGTVDITVSDLGVYVDNVATSFQNAAPCTSSATINPGKTLDCKLATGNACTAGKILKIVAPGGTDAVTCK